MFKKFRERLTTGWLGNVTSGAVGGIAGSILLPLFAWANLSPDTFKATAKVIWRFLQVAFTYQVSIWYVFAFLGAWYFVVFLIRTYKHPKNVDDDEVWNKMIGNFNFKNLCGVLQEEFLSPSKIPGSSVDNGVVLFYKYAVRFNEGLGPTTLADGGFAYAELAPRLGLHRLADKRGDIYYLNDNGALLYALLASTFQNYPEYKAKVYAIQVVYVQPLPDVVYSKDEVNAFSLIPGVGSALGTISPDTLKIISDGLNGLKLK